MSATIIRVPSVHLARGIDQTVKFVARAHRVVCRTRGLPALRVVEVADGFEVSTASNDQIVKARTPAKAFARGVHTFWTPALSA